jgi:hypothetical protein
VTITALAAELRWRCIQPVHDDREVSGAYTSDLLSDVMANAVDVELLITVQAHRNAVAVATLVGTAALVICNDRPIPDDMLKAAAAERVGIYVTDRDQFTTSGLVFRLTLPSAKISCIM